MSVLLCSAALIAIYAQTPDDEGFGQGFAPFVGSGSVAHITSRILSNTRYRPTPGDIYSLQHRMGEEDHTYTIVLEQDYDLELPYIGTLNVRNRSFTDVRATVHGLLKKAMPLEYVNFTLLSPASFDILVYGGVRSPGIITSNPMFRVSDAIRSAGGHQEGASFRRIMLTRDGKRMVVDLVRYGAQGELSQNPLLRPDDVIYVPHAVVRVNFSGRVRYPGSYEVVAGETLADVLDMAGGILPDARVSALTVSRFVAERLVRVLVDLAQDTSFLLLDGDQVDIPSLSDNPQTVVVEGALFGSPLSYRQPVQVPTTSIHVEVPYTKGMTLLDVLSTLGGPTPYAALEKARLVRESGTQTVYPDLELLWETKADQHDMELQAGDRLYVPMVDLVVYVFGEVVAPGMYPYTVGLTVKDLLDRAGGIIESRARRSGVLLRDPQTEAKTQVSLDYEPPVGSRIYVEKNAWIALTEGLGSVQGFLSLGNAVLSFIKSAWDVISLFSSP